MLYNIAFGPFLEQPSRKNLPPLAVITLHHQLHKSPGFSSQFPRCCFFARTQPDDRFANADRFARLDLHITDKAIAFVQKAKHGNPIFHRGRAFNPAFLFGNFRSSAQLLGNLCCLLLRLFFAGFFTATG